MSFGPLINVGVETPYLHFLQNENKFILYAIELKDVALIGLSIKSAVSEYRSITLIKKSLKEIASKDPKYLKLVSDIELKFLKNQPHNKNSAEYLIAAFVFYHDKNDLYKFNNFTELIDVFSELKKNIDIKSILELYNKSRIYFDTTIGNKLVTITYDDIMHNNDITRSIWKIIYINKLLKGIPYNYYSTLVEWCFIECPTMQIFTNIDIINKIKIGNDIEKLKKSAALQLLISNSIKNNIAISYLIEDIKTYATKLIESTNNVDFILDDLCACIFYKHEGNTIYDLAITGDAELIKILSNTDKFITFLSQYFISAIELAKRGIIHNDPHLNNIILAKQKSEGFEYKLSLGKKIKINACDFNLLLIDYDNSVLSHIHHNYFIDTINKLQSEIQIVMDRHKVEMTNDFERAFIAYSSYDPLRFALNLKNLMNQMVKMGHMHKTDVYDKNIKYLDKMFMKSSEVLILMYTDKTAPTDLDITNMFSGLEWIFMETFSEQFEESKFTLNESTQESVAHILSSLSDESQLITDVHKKYVNELRNMFFNKYRTIKSKSFN